MQKPLHVYKNANRVFTMLESLYAYVSDNEGIFDEILWLDTSFKPLVDIIAANLFSFEVPKLKDFDLGQITYDHGDAMDVVVCISGGKDSVALAKYYLDRGYRVHLYYAKCVNKSYPNEKDAALAVADYLGCPLHIGIIQLAGTHPFVEHPMKNIAIANGALHYAIENGLYPNIAFGNFNRSYTDDNPFEVCGGDCIDMWRAYEQIIQRVLPEFNLWVPFSTNAETYNILKGDWDLFKRTMSCITPYRFREQFKHRNENKYNIKLLDNRCGSCWKCCMEAMWLMDNDAMDYDEPFYLHCLDILSRTINKETGEAAEDIYKVWENYMFYPYKESKAYHRFSEAKIGQTGAIKFTSTAYT